MTNLETELPDYESYAVVLTHPDDEVYGAATFQRLAQAGRSVNLLYVTDGNAGGATAEVRRRELEESAALLGNVGLTQLGIPETVLWEQADAAVESVVNCLTDMRPDCVIGHDYEGGHNMHDFASFCAFLGAQSAEASFWTFPSYYGLPEHRFWNQFIPGRGPDHIQELTDKDRGLKQAVIAAHASQAAFFDRILESSSVNAFLNREVFRRAEDTDYTTPPTDPLGYETPGTTQRFDALQAIFASHLVQ